MSDIGRNPFFSLMESWKIVILILNRKSYLPNFELRILNWHYRKPESHNFLKTRGLTAVSSAIRLVAIGEVT